MTTLMTLGGILVLLALGFWWAVNTGKRLNQADALRERVDKVANINEFNRLEDEALDIFVYNFVALKILNPNFEVLEKTWLV